MTIFATFPCGFCVVSETSLSPLPRGQLGPGQIPQRIKEKKSKLERYHEEVMGQRQTSDTLEPR